MGRRWCWRDRVEQAEAWEGGQCEAESSEDSNMLRCQAAVQTHLAGLHVAWIVRHDTAANDAFDVSSRRGDQACLWMVNAKAWAVSRRVDALESA